MNELKARVTAAAKAEWQELGKISSRSHPHLAAYADGKLSAYLEVLAWIAEQEVQREITGR